MYGYVTKNLSKDEQIKKGASINKLAIIAPLLGILLIVAIDIIAIMLFNKHIFEKPTISNSLKTLKIMLYLIILLPSLPTIISLFIFILRVLTLEVAVTNKRLIGKVGLIGMQSIDIPLEQISNSTINCGFFGRLFKYESIEILSTGMKIVRGNSVGLKLNAVSNAREFINAINNCIEENKKTNA